ncbi:MAG TPA: AAA family ATPase, partial [Isosphaeraceae bacterium]|nr:AAA family ATPase [Isosphaeraceae bacterium]
YWQRPQGIVLNAGEYGQAYKPGVYRKTFERLWEQDHLVFAGFGFNDPQFTFMVGEIMRDLQGARAQARHIAILGLTLESDGALPDATAIQEWRENLEADYHVRALFYPVRGGDHSAFQVLLEGLATACGRASTTPATLPSLPASPFAPASIPSRWVHETTNDDKFTGRNDELARLDRWVRDRNLRAIAVCAVGGTGKTALVGHWLKNTSGWQSRPFAGLFGWSFYQDRDAAHFLRELLLWAHERLRTLEPQEGTDLVRAAIKVVRAHPLVIVLDGLEVLQEGPEESRHGSFLDGALRELLGAFCQQEHQGLAVLTSRFVFTDLERFLGTAFHQLELAGLLPDQGAALLGEMDVRGLAAEREQISDRLDGHPLGLRVFAEALPDADRDHPLRFLDQAFSTRGLFTSSPLNDKLRRLLAFYEQRLPLVQTRLLSVVALFRSPVADETVLGLARGLFGRMRKVPLPDDGALATELRKLQVRGILSREPMEGGHGSACHPILRDHFRALLLETGASTARRAADLLKGQPSVEEPRSLKEIEPVLLAIELLLDAGEFQAANELYNARLANGRAFLQIPAPTAGLSCALGFVRDEGRRKQCEEKTTRRRLAFYLNDVGLSAMICGQYDTALRFLSEGNDLNREMQNAINLSIGLQNKSELLVYLGRLADAKETATEALRLASENKDERQVFSNYAHRGWAATLSASSKQLLSSAEDFALANELEKKNDPDFAELYSLRGIQWAELLLRGGHPSQAARRTQANLRICERNRWNDDIARCYWMLGWCALAEARLDDAQAELRKAEPILHRGQILFDLARLHVIAGQVALERQDPADALHLAGEALALAQSRGMRLVHADALVVRGPARLLEAETDSAARAADDAEEALRLARECGYAWAERDALFLQADAHAALAASQDAANPHAARRSRDLARRAQADAQALAAKLRLTEEDLADAERKAKAWLAKWEADKQKDKEEE